LDTAGPDARMKQQDHHELECQWAGQRIEGLSRLLGNLAVIAEKTGNESDTLAAGIDRNRLCRLQLLLEAGDARLVGFDRSRVGPALGPAVHGKRHRSATALAELDRQDFRQPVSR